MDFATVAEAKAGTRTDKVMSPARVALYVSTAVNALVDAAPGALDTLNELASALGDDPDFAATVLKKIDIAAPVGAIMAFAMSDPPEGWLECNGAVLSKVRYAKLFAAIGITFGGTETSASFRVPDLRGEFLRGWDHGRGVDSGRGFGSEQGHAVERHNHYIPTSSGSTENGTVAFKDHDESTWTFDSSINAYPKTGYVITTYDIGANNYQWTGGNWADETRPRNVAMIFCIKY